MQKTYNILKSQPNTMLIAVRDFLLSLDNYTLVKDITSVVPDSRIKPFFLNGAYNFMVFRDDTYNAYLIFFIFEDNFSLICSTDFVNGRDIWYQKNVHYNGHTVFESDSVGSGANRIANYIYYLPSPTVKVSDCSLIANFNRNRNTVMLNFVYSIPIYYGTSIEHKNQHTRSMIFGGYCKYDTHVGGFFFGGDFVYTYELIHRSQRSTTTFNNTSIGTIWEPFHSYTKGQIVKKKAGDNTFYKCIKSHTSSATIDMDVLSTEPKWKSFVVPFTMHNKTYMYSYIDYACDSRFNDPSWHTATDIRHTSDSKKTWVDKPRMVSNCKAYSTHAPNPYNNHKLEVLVLAYIDYYYNKSADIIKDLYLTDTDSVALDEGEVEDLDNKIASLEAMIKRTYDSLDVEWENLRLKILDDPIIKDINNLLSLLPDIRIRKHTVTMDLLDSISLLDRLCVVLTNLGNVGELCEVLSSNSINVLRENLTANYVDVLEYFLGLDMADVIAKISNFLSSGGFNNVKAYLHSNSVVDEHYCDDFINEALVKSISLFVDVCKIAYKYRDFPYTALTSDDMSAIQNIYNGWKSYVSALPSTVINQSPYNLSFLTSVYTELINSYITTFEPIRATHERNIELKRQELSHILQSSSTTYGTRAYRLPDVTEFAVWCSSMKLGNCVEMSISIDDNYVDLPNYASLMAVGNNTNHCVIRNTLNGSSLILPLYFMVRRQPYEIDTWSALGYTNIINFVDMSYMSTNSYKNGNYPDEFTRYFCYRMGFGGDMFSKGGYPGLAFSSNNEYEDIIKISILDIEEMESIRIGGQPVLNLYNSATGVYAYGGDTVFDRGIPAGSILLKESIYNYTYLEILYTNDTASFVKSIIWNRRELLDAIYDEEAEAFDLLKGNVNWARWLITPSLSTETLLVGVESNCGIVDIRGYEVI